LVHFKSFSTGSPFKWGTNKLVAFAFFSFALSASYLILRVELHNPPFEKIIFYKYNWINTISAILIASWTEEFIFRGWVLGFLKEKGFNIIFSILYSSFLFGLWHFNIMNINSWRHSADTFFLGIIFGTLFIWSNKNIWFCTFAHLTANSCVTIFDLLEIQRSDSVTILIPSILVLVITSIVLFKSKGNQWFLKPANKNKAQI
jgi:membrane protease YdiL (CAAX protease family)